MELDGFTAHELDDKHELYIGAIPTSLHSSLGSFDSLWDQHPDSCGEILMLGRKLQTPRYQRAFGLDYHYRGQITKASPVPLVLEPVLAWSRDVFSGALNALLVNWYDGSLGHYIGRHRDTIKKMVKGAPIVTISLGEDRIFRMRPWRQPGFRDFSVSDGSVIIMPFETNLHWTHEVPDSARRTGRRISVTIRAFTS